MPILNNETFITSNSGEKIVTFLQKTPLPSNRQTTLVYRDPQSRSGTKGKPQLKLKQPCPLPRQTLLFQSL